MIQSWAFLRPMSTLLMTFRCCLTYILLTLTTYHAHAALPSSLPEKRFAMPAIESGTASQSLEQIAEKIKSFNVFIGGHPPQFQSEQQREDIYLQWSQALVDAKIHSAGQSETEPMLAVLSELYRQGHNMGVEGAGKLADETIERCIEKFKNSVSCHFSSSYFYLAISPRFAPRVERSLAFLRSNFAPRINLEVERAYIFFYVYQGKPAEAAQQIDYYLSVNASDPEREVLLKLKQGLLNQPVGTPPSPPQ
jgi:hypothetical protein